MVFWSKRWNQKDILKLADLYFNHFDHSPSFLYSDFMWNKKKNNMVVGSLLFSLTNFNWKQTWLFRLLWSAEMFLKDFRDFRVLSWQGNFPSSFMIKNSDYRSLWWLWTTARSKLWNQVPSLDHFVVQNSGDFLCWKYK